MNGYCIGLGCFIDFVATGYLVVELRSNEPSSNKTVAIFAMEVSFFWVFFSSK